MVIRRNTSANNIASNEQLRGPDRVAWYDGEEITAEQRVALGHLEGREHTVARSDTGVLANTEHFSAWKKEFYIRGADEEGQAKGSILAG